MVQGGKKKNSEGSQKKLRGSNKILEEILKNGEEN